MEPGLLVAVATAIILFGAVSQRAERSIVTPPIWFVGVGFVICGHGLGWVDLSAGSAMIHGLAELTLVVVLFTDASRIHLSCLRREGSLPARMLGIGFPLTIAAGTLAALWVFPSFGIWEAMLLAAILAPTDAALGQAVVSNPLVPVRIRQALNVESGLNDGIALPLVLLVATLAGAFAGDDSLSYWIQFAGLQLLLGPLVGGAVGFAGARLLEVGRASRWINEPFAKLVALGLAAASFGTAELVGGNGFIAAFVAGLTLGNVAPSICSSIHAFAETEGQLLTLLVFLIFGGVILPEALEHADGAAFLYAALSLTLVRMLPVAVSLAGAGLRPVSLVFLGWFGPRGLASMLFVLVVVDRGRLAGESYLHAIVMITVLLSTLAHGISAYPLARRYGGYISRVRDDAEVEHTSVLGMPVRMRHVRHHADV